MKKRGSMNVKTRWLIALLFYFCSLQSALSFHENSAKYVECDTADTCFDVVSEVELNKYDLLYCLNSCTLSNNSETGDCNSEGGSTWYKIKGELGFIEYHFSIYADFNTLISVYKGNTCENLIPVLTCDTNKYFVLNLYDTTGVDIYIKIESAVGVGTGPFNLCFRKQPVSEHNCYSVSSNIYRNQFPTLDALGPYFPGETITYCIHVDFIVNSQPPPEGNNCQWIQGIIPSLGDSWDIGNNSLQMQGPGGTWFWLPEDMVDYNVVNEDLRLYVKPDLSKAITFDEGNGNLIPGTLLPAGWWVTSNGSGAACINDGDPDNMWGDPFNCNGNQIYEFCLELKVKSLVELQLQDSIDLSLEIFVFSDGETGCWSQIACTNPNPLIIDAAIDTTDYSVITAEDIEVCNKENFDFEAYVTDSILLVGVVVSDNPNISGDDISFVLPGDSIFFTSQLTNHSNSVQEVTILLTPMSNDTNCICLPKSVKIIVYPDLSFTLPDYVCSMDTCYYLRPNTSSILMDDIYNWNDNSSQSFLKICNTAETQYALTITNALGCTWTDSTTVIFIDHDSIFYMKGTDTLILDDIIEQYEYAIELNIAQEYVDTILWTIPENLKGELIFDELGNAFLFKFEEFHLDTLNTIICAEVILTDGCSQLICKTLYIDDQVRTTDINAGEFSISPNPSKEKITLKSMNQIIERAEILSIDGKRLFAKFKINQHSLEIDVSSFSNGLYLVKINNAAPKLLVKI